MSGPAASLRVLNFSHPLTGQNLRELEALAGMPVGRVSDHPVQLDSGQPAAGQIRRLVDGIGLTPEQWQTEPLAVRLPGLEVAAALVLAELHGRTGGFPAVLRLRRLGPPTRYEVAELVDLHSVREAARLTRQPARTGARPGPGSGDQAPPA